MTKITVVLSTYNGEKFIEEQLQSLLNQRRMIDEMIICDDCSSDNTIKIIKDFISKNNLEKRWLLFQNKINIGWKKNFRNLLKKATGDFVFLCDQDDIWLPNKIAEMTDIMEKNSKIELLASNYIPKYDLNARKISSKIVKQMGNSGEIIKVSFNKQFMNVLRPGCTFAIRKSLVNEMEFFDENEFAHDAILWRLSVVRDSLYIYNKKTILFRRHGNNASSEQKVFKKYLEIYYNRQNFCRKLLDYTIEVLLEKESSFKRKILEENIDFYTNIIQSFEKKDIYFFLKSYAKYHSFYYTKKSAGLDLLLIFQEVKRRNIREGK